MSGDHSAPLAEDLEATAKLPVLDIAGAPEPPEVATDVLPVPAIPVGAPELADRLREVEEKLHREGERVRELEALLANADRRVADLEAELSASHERQQALESGLAQARMAAEQQARPAAAAPVPAPPADARDAEELRRRCDRQLEALASWQGYRGVAESLLAEAEQENARLQSQLHGASASLRHLEVEHERQAAADTLRAAEREAGLKAEIAALQAELSALRARHEQAESKAEQEAERLRDLESEIQASIVMMGDGHSAADMEHARPGPEQADLPQRLLIRRDGGSEVVHVIGRRTTIGRTPDNDIQIDAHNVSRHHAVLLAGREHCVVEDLNSTNGVLVNGQRVARQVLAHGDRLTIGKTEFTFLRKS